MSQNDLVIDNQAGAAFRADLNNALQALASQQGGSSAPSTTYPNQFWADTDAGLLRMRNAANTAWVTIGLLGVPNFGHQLPGAIVFHAKSAVPSGFLKANGAAVSRETFADLFAEIGTTFGAGDGSTTFNLPELRGEFLRCWDDGRGIDAGRTFGSWQGMQQRDHNHLLPLAMDDNGLYRLFSDAGGTSAKYGSVVTSSYFRALSGGSVTSGNVPISFSSNSYSFVGSDEVRSRNTALLACIKY